MKRYWFLTIIMLMILSACGGDAKELDDSAGGLEGVASSSTDETSAKANKNTTSTDTQVYSMIESIPNPTDQDFTMPHLDGLEGQLLFVQGNTDNQSPNLGPGGRMYLASFDGGTPVQLAERVSEPSVMVSPDGTMVGYAAVEGFSWYMYVMDLTTQEPIQLQKLANRFGFIEDWSPNMEWVLFRNNGNRLVVRVNGTDLQDLGNAFALWTTDNQLLVINVDQFFGDAQQERTVEQAYLLDPVTQNQTDLGLTDMLLTLANFQLNSLEPILAENNVELMPTSHGGAGVFGFPIVLMPDGDTQIWVEGTQFTNNIEVCYSWALQSAALSDSSEPREIYRAEDTLGLTDFTQTADGGLIFQRWYLDECHSQPEALRGEIVNITPDGQSEIITDEIYPGISTAFLRASTGKKYTLSPDGRYMIWVGGSLESTASGIYLTDLASKQTAELMTWKASDVNRFLIWEAYNAVFWVK